MFWEFETFQAKESKPEKVARGSGRGRICTEEYGSGHGGNGRRRFVTLGKASASGSAPTTPPRKPPVLTTGKLAKSGAKRLKLISPTKTPPTIGTPPEVSHPAIV